jgi:transcriptional regulator NrdR family protein
MKCTKCGEWSEVLETRKAPVWMVLRRRECGNGHRFTTYEVHAPLITRNMIRGGLAEYFKAVENRVERWQRNMRIRRDPRPTDVVAKIYGLSPDYVRQIKNLTRGPK